MGHGMPEKQRARVATAAWLFRCGGSSDELIKALADPDTDSGTKTTDSAGRRLPEAPSKSLEQRFKAVYKLLGYAERAVALQLAFYRRYPFILTPCCRSRVCFKCKVSGHHVGQSCEERQASELAIEAQYCPGCGVPTVRSEGCSSISCVCGASWS